MWFERPDMGHVFVEVAELLLVIVASHPVGENGARLMLLFSW
jgi:hypothetical protein